MNALAPTPPSRESFFALYWDHARHWPRTATAMLAGFHSAEIAGLLDCEWSELLEYQRDKLRQAVLEMLTVHEQTRAEVARSRRAARRGDGVKIFQPTL